MGCKDVLKIRDMNGVERFNRNIMGCKAKLYNGDVLVTKDLIGT